ncbi:MAG TPA: phosphate/phosphite/phosphonate ABC transporter substrate-binding protein [Caldilineae bacterium]|nr:phosphate/phosphite/phosphonate ABC transporter substrate-binding protein [Caldilineae bacterium]
MRPLRLLWILWLVMLSLGGCARTYAEPVPTVRLHRLSPLPTVSPDPKPLRVVVAAIISPKGTVASYQPLLDYLSRRLGRPVELIQRRTYAEVNDLIRRNEVDLAFVCTRAYVQGRREFGMELLAIPQVHGQTVYHSVVIVRADFPAQRFEDLRGAVFAFTDPLSNTGYLYPNVLLKRLGESPDAFFRRTFFTYSHDHAIYAVAEGVADAAAVDNLVLDYALARDPSLQDRLRIIHTSPAFGMPPVVVGPGVRPQIKALLQEILLSMAHDPEGRRALQALEVDRFVLGRDEDYELIRTLERELEGG